MADEDAPPARLGTWNALAYLFLALYLVGLGLLCYAALTTTPVPSPYALRGRPWRDYGDQRAWWPLAVQFALGMSAFLAYWLPRRRETRSFSLLVSGALGISTILLGMFSVWNCRDASPFFGDLVLALGLLLGDTPDLTAICPTNPTPLALQLAGLFGPLLIVIAALGIVVTIFRAQLDRILVRYARSLVVLVGLSDDAMPLLRRLAAGLDRRATLAVLVEDAGNPLIRPCRNLGARVVVGDLERTGSMRVLLLRRGKFKVEALYVVSADVSVNLSWAATFREIAEGGRVAETDAPPRISVRIDDPWQAEYWRRTNAYRTPVDADSGAPLRWVVDALSIHEVTASLLVDHVQSQPHDRLIVVGRSPLALAICAELAQREREDGLLGVERRPSFPELLLVGPDAESVSEQHQIRQERFGNAASSPGIQLAVVDVTEATLADLLERDTAPAVIFADDIPGDQAGDLSATLLAAMHPGWTIYHLAPGARGLAAEAIMERLYPYGLTIEPPQGEALDSWERAARIVHQTFLNSLGEGRDPNKATHQTWDRLSSFYRASNVRLVTATLAGVEAVGRTWGPPPDAGATSAFEADELLRLAEHEHRSWRRFYRENGWRYAPERDDRHRLHNALVAWSQLSPAYRERTVDNVKGALSTLQALGYRSWRVNDRAWSRVERRGEVTAAPSEHAFTWTTESGEQLRARAGDYRVSNGTGRVWSVEPSIFERTYEQIEGDRWRRTGTVLAQPAVAGELVISLEGPEVAQPGDWVLKGTAGEQWLISAEHFERNYRRAG